MEGAGGDVSTDFERLGGEQGLRAVIDDFVDRVFDDVMIGFHFGAASRERIKAKEYEFAARHLGAPIDYTGRPLVDAHGTHRILGGQFVRRLTILAETLRDHHAPSEVIAAGADYIAVCGGVWSHPEGPEAACAGLSQLLD